METLIRKIKKIDISKRGDKLIEGLNTACEIISADLALNHKSLLQSDFDIFKSKGKYWVHNTFAGGIIFLREPEVIEGIKIDFRTDTNCAKASVEYGSEKRNSRNIKYKPNAGKIESTEWNMLGIFPHFNEYEKSTKTALMMLIGSYVKIICEDSHQNSWFMKYEENFYLELLLDDQLEIKLLVEKK